jgi:predicted esterase
VSARCQLVRCERRGARPERGVLVALHADGGDARALLPLCNAIDLDCDVVAPQGPRAKSPFHSSAAPADPRWRAYAGFAWFRRDAELHPEPASFGDALAQLEALADELQVRGCGPLALLGRGDGATLALGAARAFPERVAAVVALDALPELAAFAERHALPPELPLLALDVTDTDPCGAADRIRTFLEARREGARDGRGREQEAGQDLLQAHRHG